MYLTDQFRRYRFHGNYLIFKKIITVFLILYLKKRSEFACIPDDPAIIKYLSCIVISGLRVFYFIGVVRKKYPEIIKRSINISGGFQGFALPFINNCFVSVSDHTSSISQGKELPEKMFRKPLSCSRCTELFL